MGQGLDRLLSGELSLWEYGAIVAGHNNSQKPEGTFSEYRGPMPTEQDWAELRDRSADTVARADKARAA